MEERIDHPPPAPIVHVVLTTSALRWLVTEELAADALCARYATPVVCHASAVSVSELVGLGELGAKAYDEGSARLKREHRDRLVLTIEALDKSRIPSVVFVQKTFECDLFDAVAIGLWRDLSGSILLSCEPHPWWSMITRSMPERALLISPQTPA